MSRDLVLAFPTPPASPARPLDASSKALAEVVQTYLTNFLSPHTRAAYTRDFQDFAAFLSTRGFKVQHPREIQKDHIIAYREHLREHYSPTSINRKLSALSSLFQELVGARQIDLNPVEGVKRPPAKVKRPRLGFTDQEVNRILGSHSTETLQGLNSRTVLAFLFFTGCRISEALAVKVSDIENRGNVQVVHLKGKGEKLRTLPLHPKLSKLVLELVDRREKKPTDHLFTRVKGQAISDGPLE
jgi:site-specific recombinase XerD